ncbi:hypothetical protein Y032_0010g1145 [Ancylostoma ceylanicum]|uniref:Uncharacterized protein n=1 Tax=Ancylostoma ceylanicum TaxID=53326 RepID=A0A016VI15_9BILA|nr:hypothetical protein Y032_0010g1145 [Ancylostoma ceylanicum]
MEIQAIRSWYSRLDRLKAAPTEISDLEIPEHFEVISCADHGYTVRSYPNIRNPYFLEPLRSSFSRVAELRNLSVVNRSRKVDTAAFFASHFVGKFGFCHCSATFLKFVEETKI